MPVPGLSTSTQDNSTLAFGDIGGTSFGNSGFTFAPQAPDHTVLYVAGGVVALVALVLLMRR